MLIIGNSASGKTNSLFSLTNQHSDINKIYLYAQGPYEAKYQFWINEKESTGWKHFNNCKSFIEYSNDTDDIDKTIEE